MTTTPPAAMVQAARKSATWIVSACGGVAALALSLLPATSHAIEEPVYTVVRTLGDIELREYTAYTVAEVIVDADAKDAGSRAFPILAGYIFGKNKGERSLAMTAPVTQTAVPVKLAMTAPVSQTPAGNGHLVQFVLPRGVTVANAPEPLDTRVNLREMPSQRVAVIRYSGFWSESNYNDHLTKLQEGLRAADIAWTGDPVFSRYDGPATPWFMRRNEIWLTLTP